MADENSNTTGNFWGGIWDAVGTLGTAAASMYVAQQAAKGTATPGGAGAGTPAVQPAAATAGGNNNLMMTLAIGAVAIVVLFLGIKLVKK